MAATLCSWEVNCRSCVALAMRYVLQWSYYLWTRGLWKRDEQPTYGPMEPGRVHVPFTISLYTEPYDGRAVIFGLVHFTYSTLRQPSRYIYSITHMHIALYILWPDVRLSMTSQCCIETAEHIQLVFGWEASVSVLFSTGIQVSPKIRGISLDPCPKLWA